MTIFDLRHFGSKRRGREGRGKRNEEEGGTYRTQQRTWPEFNGFRCVHARVINASRFIAAPRLDSPNELYRYCFTTFLRRVPVCRVRGRARTRISGTRARGDDLCANEPRANSHGVCCKIYAGFICVFCDVPVTTRLSLLHGAIMIQATPVSHRFVITNAKKGTRQM